MNKLVLGFALGLAVAAAAWFLLHDRKPAAEAGAPAPKVTGVYADDWQANCGPLAGAAQAECTTRLDRQYGRTAGAPVPGK